MLINLIQLWKQSRDQTPPEHLNTPQSSLHFDTPPRIIFLSNLATMTKAFCYQDLPVVLLKPAEQVIYQQKLNTLSYPLYNGNHILLTNIVYDTVSHTLYLEAVRVDYAFLLALKDMQKLNENASALQRDFFKTGVLAPFITKDDKVPIMARNDKWQLCSVAGGFLECHSLQENLSDLIIKTAIREAEEEFVLDKNGQKRFDFASSPRITSISFREDFQPGSLCTMEFIAPVEVNSDADFIVSIMNNNEAQDKHEHITGTATSISIRADERNQAIQFLNKHLPGNFYYGPVLHACAQHNNSGTIFAQRLPQVTQSRFFHARMFHTQIKGLKHHTKDKDGGTQPPNSFSNCNAIAMER